MVGMWSQLFHWSCPQTGVNFHDVLFLWIYDSDMYVLIPKITQGYFSLLRLFFPKYLEN